LNANIADIVYERIELVLKELHYLVAISINRLKAARSGCIMGYSLALKPSFIINTSLFANIPSSSYSGYYGESG